jgi:hypothetical protein
LNKQTESIGSSKELNQKELLTDFDDIWLTGHLQAEDEEDSANLTQLNCMLTHSGRGDSVYRRRGTKLSHIPIPYPTEQGVEEFLAPVATRTAEAERTGSGC